MLTAVLLEDALWAEAPEPRRQEWRLSIRELLDEHSFAIEASPLIARVFLRDDRVDVRWETPEKGVVAETPIERAELDRVLSPYLAACRELMALANANDPRLGPLDQAKKNAHDEGARELVRLFTGVGPSHTTARRLFTLFVTLLVDTSTLAVLRRPHESD